ncbi:MAG: hypothetical protein Q8O19_02810, partial [Rectinemataceae bacterium]|nr:hypothetical protein [Rectinemataceae bacterium]
TPIALALTFGLAAPAHAWRVDTSSGITMLKLSEAGNFGVGISNPDPYRFIVRGSTDDATAWTMWIGGRTSAIPSIVVRNDGMVGIGTSSPTHGLHVNANTVDGVATMRLSSKNAGDNHIRYDYPSDGSKYWVLGTDGNVGPNDFLLWNFPRNSVDLTVKEATGNVGIGTYTPTAKLEVAGQVKITGGSPGAGKVLTSDASGLASWLAGGGRRWKWSLCQSGVEQQ